TTVAGRRYTRGCAASAPARPRRPSQAGGARSGTRCACQSRAGRGPPLPACAKTLIRSTNITRFSVKQLELSSVEVFMRLQRLSLIGFLAFAGFCCAQTSPTPMPVHEICDIGIDVVITVGQT